MGRFFSFLFLIAVFAGAFYIARFPFPTVRKTMPDAGHIKFQATHFPRTNHSFVFLLSSGPSLAKTIHTIALQTYDHYRIVCLDQTAYLATRSTSLEKRTSLASSEEGRLSAIFHATMQCKANEIVIILDSSGWLAHEWVLSRLNQYYADPDLWMTYGQDQIVPLYSKGISRPYTSFELSEQKFRTYPFVASALQTFYAALFQKIDLKDLTYEGKFLPAAIDQAYFFPMLEMARDHFQCVPEILYLSSEPLIPKEEIFVLCDQYLRALPPYKPIYAL